jgi:3-phosphoshikimate 1-carboxyvinyltransferase
MSDPVASHPDPLPIQPLRRPPMATVRVPGSKSITNRALVLAALNSNCYGCELHGVLRSEDTEVMVEALRQLGFLVRTDWNTALIHVDKEEDQDRIPTAKADLFVANSGTTMRFLTALVSLGHGRYRLDGVPRMRERPIEDLLSALRQLGVRARSEPGNGCPPVLVEANGLRGGAVKIKGDVSSQFLSGLLMAASAAEAEVYLDVEGPLVSAPYVAMTVEMMRHWGRHVETTTDHHFRIPGGQETRLGRYDIEPDASAASYFWAAAAITGGEVYVQDLTIHSLQGDVRFVEVLEEMGCTVVRGETGLTVKGGARHGIDVDMNDISDTVMTLAAVACFAEGPTTIRNVAHIRHKETDRLAALATELRRVGAGIEEFADGITILPAPLHGAAIETYNDHRMAMSLALVGLQVPGIVIKNPACVSKTYPGFFADLEKLRC